MPLASISTRTSSACAREALSTRSIVNFVNWAQLSKFHSYVTCPPMSRHFTFTEGSRLVRVRCYLHDDTHAAEGWYPPAERVLEFSKPFYWS